MNDRIDFERLVNEHGRSRCDNVDDHVILLFDSNDLNCRQCD